MGRVASHELNSWQVIDFLLGNNTDIFLQIRYS
jgi:hypothetical protein